MADKKGGSMKGIKNNLRCALCVASYAFLFSGCIVRSYSVVKDRVDQEVSGNQGYLRGSAPANAQPEKKFNQRKTKVVEIELRSPIKFEKLKEPSQTAEKSQGGSNLGAIEVSAPAQSETQGLVSPTPKVATYVVQKNDTLQKISARPEIYGTTKRWKKIFEANKDKLKSPDKLRPGQELKIPRD